MDGDGWWLMADGVFFSLKVELPTKTLFIFSTALI